VFGGGAAQAGVDDIQAVIETAVIQMGELVFSEQDRIRNSQASINNQQTALNDLDKDYKSLKG
jgi:hypothetical protein